MTSFTPTLSAACRRLDEFERSTMMDALVTLSSRWHECGYVALAQVMDALVLELAEARDEHATMVETFEEIVSPVVLLDDDDPDVA